MAAFTAFKQRIWDQSFTLVDSETLRYCDTTGDEVLCIESSGVTESGASFEYRFVREVAYFDDFHLFDENETTTLVIENTDENAAWQSLSYNEQRTRSEYWESDNDVREGSISWQGRLAETLPENETVHFEQRYDSDDFISSSYLSWETTDCAFEIGYDV